MSRSPDAVIHGLHFFERPIDESERRQGIARRVEVRDPLALRPKHVHAAIQLAGSGDVMCSCDGGPDCAHLASERLYFAEPPNLESRVPVPA